MTFYDIGPPNPPENCYYKENNATVIIECTPGFHQGDPEMYYYLMKKKPNGVLIEYARKRDSCSFLISKSILEEYLNEFFIYSSNKYGNNKESAAKLVIQNEEILLKNPNKTNNNQDNQLMMLIIAGVGGTVFFLGICCCLCMKCKKTSNHEKNTHYDDYRQKTDIDFYGGNKFTHLSINFKIKFAFIDHRNSLTQNENQILENEKLYSSIRIKEKPITNKSLTSTFIMKGKNFLS